MMRPAIRFLLVPSLLALAALAPAQPAAERPAAGPRTFLFTYAGAITGLAPGEKARVWLPLPPTNQDQEVRLESRQLPAEAREGKDPQYGNAILYFEAAAGADGNVPFSLTYRVKRNEVAGPSKGEADGALVKRYLEADKLVPVGGAPLEEIRDKLSGLKGRPLPEDPAQAARALYDAVNGHMRYDKSGTGWGRGDAVWACNSRHGNCTDFHSLFIALARSQKIPAKFEIGFGLPEKRGAGDLAGYHCWAKFLVADKGWVPVDISEANKDPSKQDYYFGHLSVDRVAFSEGRDLMLAPPQDGPPLNYFVYPYAEVGGRPCPAEKVRKQISYRDVE